MDTEFDFKKLTATNDEWSFKIDKHEFICVETTLGDEADLFNFYIDPDGKENIAKLRMAQATKLKTHPFTSEWIKHIFTKFYPDYTISKDVTWERLTPLAKLQFLGKLESKFMSKIMVFIGDHYSSKEELIKN